MALMTVQGLQHWSIAAALVKGGAVASQACTGSWRCQKQQHLMHLMWPLPVSGIAAMLSSCSIIGSLANTLQQY